MKFKMFENMLKNKVIISNPYLKVRNNMLHDLKGMFKEKLQ